MSTRFNQVHLLAPVAEPIPEIRPWREAGWIFRDGGVLAIERQGEHTRARATSVSHLHNS